MHTVAEVEVKRHEHVFGIVTPARTYYVSADSRADMLDWVRKIDNARIEAERAGSEEQTQISPAKDDDDTPQGEAAPGSSTSASQPIAMGKRLSGGQYGGGASSYASSSAMSGEVLSSSLESSSAVPPSPLLDSSSLASPRDEVAGFRLAGAPRRQLSRRREGSAGGGNTSSGGESASYFPSHSRPQAPGLLRSPTGGLASSSEDEDDDELEPATPVIGEAPPEALAMRPAKRIDLSQIDPQKVVMSGYLTKQGKRKVWRKRYFTLISSRLIYSHSHMVRRAISGRS